MWRRRGFVLCLWPGLGAATKTSGHHACAERGPAGPANAAADARNQERFNVLTALDFVSQAVFERIEPTPTLAVVSIGDPAQPPPDRLPQFQQVLRLEFLDLEPDDAEDCDIADENLFSPAQLLALTAYVQGLHQQAAHYRLVVHCHAGISRSAAVALVAHHITNCDFPRHLDAHYANRHVIRVAESALPGCISIPPAPRGEEPHLYQPQRLLI